MSSDDALIPSKQWIRLPWLFSETARRLPESEGWPAELRRLGRPCSGLIDAQGRSWIASHAEVQAAFRDAVAAAGCPAQTAWQLFQAETLFGIALHHVFGPVERCESLRRCDALTASRLERLATAEQRKPDAGLLRSLLVHGLLALSFGDEARGLVVPEAGSPRSWLPFWFTALGRQDLVTAESPIYRELLRLAADRLGVEPTRTGGVSAPDPALQEFLDDLVYGRRAHPLFPGKPRPLRLTELPAELREPVDRCLLFAEEARKARAEAGSAVTLMDSTASHASVAGLKRPAEDIPARLGSWELVERLGSGAQGAVFLGVSESGERAAIKLLNATDDAKALQRFGKEVEILLALAHEGIFRIHDYGGHAGRVWYAMEAVEGGSLEDRLRADERLTESAFRELAIQLLEALDAAWNHPKRFVHRDLKPGNILIRGDGRAVISDFGFGTGTSADATRMTMEGTGLGTPLFMAPEQLQAAREVDTRADLWALGVIAVRSLTGHYPFPGPRVFRQIRKSAPRLHESFKDLSPGLQAWVLRLLEKDPGLRPASPREALDELIAIAPEQAGPVAEPLGRAVSLLAPTGHRLFLFAGASLPFGRDPGSPEALCLRPLPDSRGPAARRLSRVHGRFETRGGRFFLTDTSSHGISRGGEQLERDRPVELYAGDGLDVGAGAVTMRAWPMEGGLLLTRDDEPRHALLWVTGTARVPTAILARTGWPAMVLRLARKDAALCLLDDPSERPVVPGELVTTGGIAWRVEDYDAAHFKSPAG